MKLIIDIPEEDYKNGTLINYFKCYSTELDKIIYDGTPLEAQPNRCDSCTHSEEQDGSNCYECVKGMADNFETQPTDAVNRSDVEYIVRGSLCDLRRNEDKQIFINTLNSLPSVQPQPCEDCISRKDAIKEFQSYREYSSNRTNNEWVDRIEGVLKLLPSVTPQRMQEVNADGDSD